MSINRRNFLKGSLLGAGVALTGFTGCTSTNKSEVEAVVKECVEKGKNRKQLFNMCGYAAAPIPVVRIGYVGIGSRGSWAVTRILNIKEIEIRGLCDLREEAVKKNQETLKNFNKRPAEEYFGDEYAWKKLCEQEDLYRNSLGMAYSYRCICYGMWKTCSSGSSCRKNSGRMLAISRNLGEDKKTLHAVGKLLL